MQEKARRRIGSSIEALYGHHERACSPFLFVKEANCVSFLKIELN